MEIERERGGDFIDNEEHHEGWWRGGVVKVKRKRAEGVNVTRGRTRLR